MGEIYRITEEWIARHNIAAPQPLPETLRRALESEARWNANKTRAYARHEAQRKRKQRTEYGALTLAAFAAYGIVRMALDAYLLFCGKH